MHLTRCDEKGAEKCEAKEDRLDEQDAKETEVMNIITGVQIQSRISTWLLLPCRVSWHYCEEEA